MDIEKQKKSTIKLRRSRRIAGLSPEISLDDIKSNNTINKYVYDENDDICIICLDKPSEYNKYNSECNHTLCIQCASQWINIKENCPLCNHKLERLTIDMYDMENIYECKNNNFSRIINLILPGLILINSIKEYLHL